MCSSIVYNAISEYNSLNIDINNILWLVKIITENMYCTYTTSDPSIVLHVLMFYWYYSPNVSTEDKHVQLYVIQLTNDVFNVYSNPPCIITWWKKSLIVLLKKVLNNRLIK